MQKIEAWKTIDGKIFNTQTEARDHETNQDIDCLANATRDQIHLAVLGSAHPVTQEITKLRNAIVRVASVIDGVITPPTAKR